MTTNNNKMGEVSTLKTLCKSNTPHPMKDVLQSLSLYICIYIYCRVLGCCVTYKWVLNWRPGLLHTYTTCYYTLQTTTWHAMSSLLHHLRLPSQETPSVLLLSCLRSSLDSLGTKPRKTPSLDNNSIVGRCRGNEFTRQLPSNRYLLWLYYSGSQETCHSVYIRFCKRDTYS
jgi:hypothetical protein